MSRFGRLFFAISTALCACVVMPARADYAASCAGCHAASATPEVNNLPNGSGLSGSIRAANNLTYLNTKISAGMGGGTTSGLSQAARQAIATEIGSSSSVSAPAFTSAAAPNGTVLSSYSHTFTASAAPLLVGNAGLSTPFTLNSGSLPPGLNLNGATGALTGTPNTGGSYSGSIRANNLIGAGTTQTFNIFIAKLSQTVSFNAPPSPVYAPGGEFSVSASATSGLAVTYTATGTCSVPNTNVGTISISGAGTCNVIAFQGGNGTYNSASALQAVTIAKANQTISFGAQSPSTRTYAAGLSFALNPAAAGGPLPAAITYTTNSSQICTVSGTTVNVGPLAGTCTITATQNGDANYNSISAVQSIVIDPTAPTAPAIDSTVPGNAQATFAFTTPVSDGGSPITGYRATCDPGNVFFNGPTSPIVLMGLTNMTLYTCSVAAINAVGSATSAPVTVTPTDGSIPPGFTSTNSATFTMGSAGMFTVTAVGTPAATLSMSGTLPNGVAFTPATGVIAGTPPPGTVGTYSVTLTAANGTPPNATQPFTLTVEKAAQTISFPAIASQILNGAQVVMPASASSGLAVTYTSLTTGVCTVSGRGVTKVTLGTCTIAASQAGNANYAAAAQVTQSFGISATVPGSVGQGNNDWFNGGGFLQFQGCANCHGSPNGLQLNAARTGSLISFVYAVNFAGQHPSFPNPPSQSQANNLAAYIGTLVAGTNPVNRPILHNTSVGFTLPNIGLGGTMSSIAIVTSPGKGMVSMSGTTAIYTPFTGQSGPDAFSYRASGAGGFTETRTATVVIDNPPAPAIASASSASGATGTAFSFNLTASNAPTLYGASGLPPGLYINTSTGQIYGTPTASGSYIASVSAGNAGGTDTATLTLNIVGPPSAPTNVNAQAGDGQITINFTNPLNNGGAVIVSYSVICNPGTFTVDPAVSPTVVTGLANGTTYTCDVRANNGTFTGLPASVSATPRPPLALVGIFSRKMHGAAGDFDMELFDGQPLDGGRNIEPRAIGTGFKIVFQFNRTLIKDPVVVIGPNDGNPVPGTAAFALAGDEIIVTVTGIPDNSIYRVGIDNVDGQTGFNVLVNVAFLVGEVNDSRAVNASDISGVKAHAGLTVKQENFQFDLNADGAINNADVLAVKARSGKVLP